MIEALVEALLTRNHPADIRVIDEHHPELVLRLAELRPDLLNDADAWIGVSETTAKALMLRVPLGNGSAVAAIRAGHGNTVLRSIGPAATAKAIAYDGTYADATELLASIEPIQISPDCFDDLVVLLLVALFGNSQVDDDLPDRLERRRTEVGEFWLRAAVQAVVSKRLSPSDFLTVAFRPLHEAITSDRLPRECWKVLDEVLPPASDPALRLRRYPLSIAQQEHWTGQQFERALRGAGPHADQLLRDVPEGDDWWVAATRAVVRAAVGFFGGHF